MAELLSKILEKMNDRQEKKDEAKVLMDEGWALHLKMKADEEGMHFEALDILFEALDILESQ